MCTSASRDSRIRQIWHQNPLQLQQEASRRFVRCQIPSLQRLQWRHWRIKYAKRREFEFGIPNSELRHPILYGSNRETSSSCTKRYLAQFISRIAAFKKRCCGLKVYFDHSTGNQGADQETIQEAFKVCGELGIPLVAHCEDAEINSEFGIRNSELRDISTHSKNRPPESEIAAIKRAIDLAREYGTQFHVAHLSTAGGCNWFMKPKRRIAGHLRSHAASSVFDSR